MRADARQNRQRLLEAATELFATAGLDVSVAQIVEAAGVGPPTLYRHFGGKQGLIDAINEQLSQAGLAALARAMSQPTGWDGLVVALNDSIELARTNRAVREGSGLGIPAALERLLLTAWAELIERAQAEGRVRSDFTAADLPYLFHGIGAVVRVTGYDAGLRERFVALFMDSLRPGAHQSLPLPGPTPEQVHDSFSPAPVPGKRAG